MHCKGWLIPCWEGSLGWWRDYNCLTCTCRSLQSGRPVEVLRRIMRVGNWNWGEHQETCACGRSALIELQHI